MSIERYRADWSQDSTMRVVAFGRGDAAGEFVTYTDHAAEVARLELLVKYATDTASYWCEQSRINSLDADQFAAITQRAERAEAALDTIATMLPRTDWTHPSGDGYRATFDIGDVRVATFHERRPLTGADLIQALAPGLDRAGGEE